MRVISYGLGAIGCEIARHLLGRGDEIVAAVDVDPDKTGRDVGRLLGGPPTGVPVTASAEEALAAAPDALVVHATSSRLRNVAPQLLGVVAAGHSVVSTCEELVYPRTVDAALAATLDERARAAGATVVGAGINPGFLMDVLVLTLSGVCRRVDAVRVRRVVDTNRRRLPLQEKVGVGLDAATFRRRAADGRLGHVGLAQSVHMVAESLGWTGGAYIYQERLEPVLAVGEVHTGLGPVGAGRALGQRQVASATVDGREVVRMELEMYAGADPLDAVDIDGVPDLRQRIEGGVNGDAGTVAVVANQLPLLRRAPAGLSTLGELLPLRFVRGNGGRTAGGGSA